MGLSLNLGSCDRHFPDYINVDIVPPADQIVDLSGPWPWPDSSVSRVLAYDVLEHIEDCSHVHPAYTCYKCEWLRGLILPNSYAPLRDPYGKRHCLNELWRVLEPGGTATVQVPHASDGHGGHCDPTHRTYWTQSDFEYYYPGIFERERFRTSTYYGVKADFIITNLVDGKIRTQKHPRKLGGHVVEMLVELQAVKEDVR